MIIISALHDCWSFRSCFLFVNSVWFILKTRLLHHSVFVSNTFLRNCLTGFWILRAWFKIIIYPSGFNWFFLSNQFGLDGVMWSFSVQLCGIFIEILKSTQNALSFFAHFACDCWKSKVLIIYDDDEMLSWSDIRCAFIFKIYSV